MSTRIANGHGQRGGTRLEAWSTAQRALIQAVGVSSRAMSLRKVSLDQPGSRLRGVPVEAGCDTAPRGPSRVPYA
jgi:hypothetical protein